MSSFAVVVSDGRIAAAISAGSVGLMGYLIDE